MPERTSLGRRLLDRLRGRRPADVPVGEAHRLDLVRAIALVEARSGAAVYADAAEAVGASLAGRRVALATTLGERTVHAALGPALDRGAPLVVWLETSGLPALGTLPDGAVVFAPSSAQEAIDLGLVARRLTESSLLPVVLLVSPFDEQELSLPDSEALATLLGDPADDIEVPTPTQRAVFGPHRRRVPAWFDSARAMATGAAARDELAASARRARHLVFEAPAAALADAACAEVEEATGRPLSAVEVTEVRKAPMTVVAAGALGAMEQPGVARVRPIRLQPFPTEAVTAGLWGAKEVAVLQDGRRRGPGSLTGVVWAAYGGEVRVGWRPLGDSQDQEALNARVGSFLESAAVRACVGVGVADTTGLPRRDAAVQQLREAAPQLASEALPAVSTPPLLAGRGDEPQLPALLRRIPAERQAPDSLPRLWGEVLQPGRMGLPPAPTAMVATGAAPGGANALQPAIRGDRTMPVLKAEACTGCGACWAACPDSAFAATALTLPALLDAAADASGTSGQVASAVRRGHKNLAGKLAKSFATTPVPTGETWRAAWDWLAGKLDLGDERPTHDTAWKATEDVLVQLRPFSTEILFVRAGAAKKGSGALLLLGVDPDACTGCGLCVRSCEPGALSRVQRTPELVDTAREHHALHEGLPDTSGETIAWLQAQPEGDLVRGLLLSRHCAEAQVGGGTTEPGSGARLAARLATAFAEEHGARGQAGLLAALEDRREGLKGRLGSLFAEPIAARAAGDLARAAAAGGARIDLEELARKLDNGGPHTTVDAEAVKRLAECEVAVEGLIQKLKHGQDGLGAARFAALVAAPALEPLLRYPGHPWFAPTVVAEPQDVVPMARALATSLVEDHVAAVRVLRRADLLVRNPSDLRSRLAALDTLSWRDLSVEDRAACPALLVLVGPEGGDPADASGLGPLLRQDLPVRILLLDGQDAPGAGPDPALLAVASGASWVGSTSPAFPEHLGPTLRAALNAKGPSLVVLHAPSPERLGFHSDQTLEVARKAVAARVAPLFRFDPTQDGLHEKYDLSGNPEESAADAFDSWLKDQPLLSARLTADERALAHRAVKARWEGLKALAGPPPAPVEAPAPPPAAPTIDRADVEAELRVRLATNLRRLAHPGG